jgi:hypothetical protein
MTPDYVESLNPQERQLYWAYFLEESKQENKQEGQFDVLDENIPAGINM